MSLSTRRDAQMLLEVASKAVSVLLELSSIACLLDLIYNRPDLLLEPIEIACARVDKDQRSLTVGKWQGDAHNCTLRIVRRRPGDAKLQAIFQARGGKDWQGLRDAGLRGDLRDFHRRTALLSRQARRCIIDINMPLTLPPEVETRVQERGPTEYVPSGDPKEFKDKVLQGLRAHEQQRLAGWGGERQPAAAYGHPTISLSRKASPSEAAVSIGLCLCQEGMLDDAVVKPLLIKELSVPLGSVDEVWEKLQRLYAYPQHPLGLRAYISRIVNSRGTSVLWDNESGEEYLTIERAAEELGKHKTTFYRWIEHKNDEITVKEFSYQVRSGVQKTVKVVARSEVDRLKEQQNFAEYIVELLRKAHKIERPSAERKYRRLKKRLYSQHECKLTDKDVMEALRGDPKVVRFLERQRLRRKQSHEIYGTQDNDPEEQKTQEKMKRAAEQEAVNIGALQITHSP